MEDEKPGDNHSAPPSAPVRLWNPPSQKPPVRIPYVSDKVLKVMEDLGDPARKAVLLIFILVMVGTLALSFDVYGAKVWQDAGAGPGAFLFLALSCIAWIAGLVSLPLLGLNRHYYHALLVFCMLLYLFSLHYFAGGVLSRRPFTMH